MDWRRDEEGRYLFFLAGERHRCPPGQRFFAGVGGHLEPGETWVECARREALEEVGAGVDLLDAEQTWHIHSSGGPGTPIGHRLLTSPPRTARWTSCL